MTVVESRKSRMLERVRELYEHNRQRGVAAWCGFEYDFVCPSMGTYPFQWFWDSCFHAIVLSHFDVVRAESEIRSLLRNQQMDGFVAHVTFWQRERFEALLSTYGIAYRTPYLSDCMQPPVLAEAVDAIIRRGGSPAFLVEVLPKVKRYFDWLDRVRDPDRDGLISIIQPDESGLDQSPKYDRYARLDRVDLEGATASWTRITDAYKAVDRDPVKMLELDVFNVEDVMVNVIYAENLRVLAELCARAGERDASDTYARRAKKTSNAIVTKCWNAERRVFFDLAGRREEQQKVNTVTSLFPLLLPDLPRKIVEALVGHLEDPKRYAAQYPVPTVAMDEPTFVPGVVGTKLLWRGPTWFNTNWYLARGLRRHGAEALARRIAERSADLVEREGFREYYNPLTGEGHGAQNFGWSALVLDLL
jgi:hypothetical protein